MSNIKQIFSFFSSLICPWKQCSSCIISYQLSWLLLIQTQPKENKMLPLSIYLFSSLTLCVCELTVYWPWIPPADNKQSQVFPLLPRMSVAACLCVCWIRSPQPHRVTLTPAGKQQGEAEWESMRNGTDLWHFVWHLILLFWRKRHEKKAQGTRFILLWLQYFDAERKSTFKTKTVLCNWLLWLHVSEFSEAFVRENNPRVITPCKRYFMSVGFRKVWKG